ncbi:MAG: M23 family metallopeptidase [Myxococcales bacterium]|nr:M23 family metallopeptidase [Myxococcales bacterium]
MDDRLRVGLREALGIKPLLPALQQAWRGLAGSEHLPASQWGPSSLRIFKPRITVPTWLDRLPPRRTPIYNFVNRVPQPAHEGYSVRVTYARDWRGGRFTYDGHIGTDFAVPVGTPMVAPAPGVVVGVPFEMDRGGRKVVLDHGDGLLTSYSHLSRAAVRPGRVLARGELLGWSGASGMEFVLCFPWVAPHLHFNVLLDGRPIDPFATEGEVSVWRQRNDPVPWDGARVAADADFRPTDWVPAAVEASINGCLEASLRTELRALPTLAQRAAGVLVGRVYRPTLFPVRPDLYAERHAPTPRLDLPFRAADFDGILLPP